jgi:hypothetical protein
MKHGTVDGRDGSWSHNSRRHHSGVNGCCTAMWKANGKTTTLVLFLDSLFPEVWKRLWTCRKTECYLKNQLLYESTKTLISHREECAQNENKVKISSKRFCLQFHLLLPVNLYIRYDADKLQPTSMFTK